MLYSGSNVTVYSRVVCACLHQHLDSNGNINADETQIFPTVFRWVFSGVYSGTDIVYCFAYVVSQLACFKPI